MDSLHKLILVLLCCFFWTDSFSHTAICDHNLVPRRSESLNLSKKKSSSFSLAPIMTKQKQLPLKDSIVEHKILILSALPIDQDSSAKAAIKFMGFVGIPFEIIELTDGHGRKKQVNLEFETSSSEGRYSGVILTEFNLSYFDLSKNKYISALSHNQWEQLNSYILKYQLRTVSLMTYPQQYLGVNASIDGGTQRDDEVFLSSDHLNNYATDLKRDVPVSLKDVWHYPVQIIHSSNTQGLLKSTNHPGDFLATFHQTQDGRQQMHFYFPQHPELILSRWIAPFWVKWLNQNVHLGQRQAYLNLQVDDLLIPTHLWSPKLMNSEGEVFRIDPTDIESFLNFQDFYLRPQTKNKKFKIEMAYNGKGLEDYGGLFEDPLSLNLKKNLEQFTWLTHTYHHLELDHVSYETALEEVSLNREVELDLNHRYSAIFSQQGIVTPRISGLKNPEVLKALYHAGKKFVVGDNTVADLRPREKHYLARRTQEQLHGHDGLMIIPRDPNDIFYNVSIPEELDSLFNHLYYPKGDHYSSFEQILDKNTDEILGRLLDYDLSSNMFHQANMRHFSYQGRWTSLMSEWLKGAIEKYRRLSTLPIKSLDMDALSEHYLQREVIENCRVEVFIHKRYQKIKELKIKAESSCRAPLTFNGPVTILNPSSYDFIKYGPDFIYSFDLTPTEELSIQL